MSLDLRVKRFLDLLAASNPGNALEATVAQRRSGLVELMKFGGPAVPVERAEDVMLPGPTGANLPVRVYTPLGLPATLLPGLVYFHGGGMVAGSLDTHDGIARALAHAAGCRVVAVGYRLAPEHVFPAALDDALTAVTHIAAHAENFGIDMTRLGLCGDSAGATLAAATSQALLRLDGPRIAAQVLLCPILDYSRSTPSRRDFGTGYLVDQATLDHDLLHYLPRSVDASEPRVSPLLALGMHGMPPSIVHTAEFDPLRDEGRLYAERVREAGSSVTYCCHPGMIHLFYGLGGVIPYARTALAQIGLEIRAALG